MLRYCKGSQSHQVFCRKKEKYAQRNSKIYSFSRRHYVRFSPDNPTRCDPYTIKSTCDEYRIQTVIMPNMFGSPNLIYADRFMDYMGGTVSITHTETDSWPSCNGFEITFVSEKHMVEDDTMYCLQIIWRENRGFRQRLWGAAIPHGEDMVQAGCD